MKTFIRSMFATSLPVAALLLSNTAAAAGATTASDSASWTATATKDSSSSFVISQAKSYLTFDYSAASTQFSTDSDTLTASVIGDASADGFTIKATLVSNELTSSGNNTIYVEPTIGGQQVTSEGVTLYDYNNAQYAFGNITPTTDSAGAQVSDTATVTFTPYSDSSLSLRNFSGFDDGTYTGIVQINFLATWSSSE